MQHIVLWFFASIDEWPVFIDERRFLSGVNRFQKIGQLCGLLLSFFQNLRGGARKGGGIPA